MASAPDLVASCSAVVGVAVPVDQGARSRSSSPPTAGEGAGTRVGRDGERAGRGGTSAVDARARRRHARLGELCWSGEQQAVLARAERLRLSGRGATAANVVATGCPLPVGFRVAEHALCVQLDLPRWYEALMGEPWDGGVLSLSRAQERADELRRRPTAAREACAHGSFRMCHLLVEPLAALREESYELDDFSATTGWPGRYNAGSLQWARDDGLACCYCDALLLPSEAVYDVSGVHGVARGRYCCSNGCVVAARRAL